MISIGALRAAGQGEALEAAIQEGMDLSVAAVLTYVRD